MPDINASVASSIDAGEVSYVEIAGETMALDPFLCRGKILKGGD